MLKPPDSSLRGAVIGSGSGGNATLVRTDATTLLIDCGYSVKEFELRASALEFDPSSLSGILVTHEHDDHVGGVVALARKYQVPIFATRGTRIAQEARAGQLANWRQISAHDAFTIGDIGVQPVPVPHDAREPSQFIFRHAEVAFGILTDLGSLTSHVVEQYRQCDALLLEFNHDPALLAGSVYPARLKRRIAGAYGHLSNGQAQSLLQALQAPKLRYVVAAHLSERTNNPDLVAACLSETAASVGGFKWSIAAQDAVLPWFAVGEVRV